MSINRKYLIGPLAALAVAAAPAVSFAQLLGPSPYLSFNNSPLNGFSFSMAASPPRSSRPSPNPAPAPWPPQEFRRSWGAWQNDDGHRDFMAWSPKRAMDCPRANHTITP